MATKRPYLCPRCGSQVKKTGYCSGCDIHMSVLKKAYNTSDYYYNIGYDRAMARDLSGAIESLKVSLRYNKKNIMSRNLLGLIYYEMGEVVMALSHFVMSVNYEPSGNLASKYLKELRQDPTRLDNENQIAKKFNMALSYAASDDPDLAIIQLKSALAANPHFVKGYLLLGLLYIDAGNYEKARKTLRRVLKIDKANVLAIHYLHEMGDTDENIIQMRNESIENDGLLDDENVKEVSVKGESLTKTQKTNPVKEFIARQKERIVKTGELGEISLVRYSGLYVLLGMFLGILLLYFVVVPKQEKKMRSENEKIVQNYSEEINSKDATILTLNEQIGNMQLEIDDLKNPHDDSDNPLPDYSQIQNGMSPEDIQSMINNE